MCSAGFPPHAGRQSFRLQNLRLLALSHDWAMVQSDSKIYAVGPQVWHASLRQSLAKFMPKVYPFGWHTYLRIQLHTSGSYIWPHYWNVHPKNNENWELVSTQTPLTTLRKFLENCDIMILILLISWALCLDQGPHLLHCLTGKPGLVDHRNQSELSFYFWNCFGKIKALQRLVAKGKKGNLSCHSNKWSPLFQKVLSSTKRVQQPMEHHVSFRESRWTSPLISGFLITLIWICGFVCVTTQFRETKL